MDGESSLPGDSEDLWVDRWEWACGFGFGSDGREVLTNNVRELKNLSGAGREPTGHQGRALQQGNSLCKALR